jgi:hypothetical protein
MKRHQHQRRAELNVEGLPRTRLGSRAIGKKGDFDRRIIGREVDNGREFTLHATKGYRSTLA